jgi:hypothetical protein
VRERQLDPDNPLVRTAVFGKEVEEFLASPIGDYLIKSAEKELATAIEQLKKIAPDKPIQIVALQTKIELLEHFESWLGAAVESGHVAIRALDGEDEIDG